MFSQSEFLKEVYFKGAATKKSLLPTALSTFQSLVGQGKQFDFDSVTNR